MTPALLSPAMTAMSSDAHSWMTGFLLSALIFRAVSDDTCVVPTCSEKPRSAFKGRLVSIPLNLPETTLDLCKQNGSTSNWDHIYSFVSGVPMKLNSYFKETVSVSGGNFTVENVSAEAAGNYVFQDSNKMCLAHVKLSVVDPPPPNSANPKGAVMAWFWYLIPLLSLLWWP